MQLNEIASERGHLSTARTNAVPGEVFALCYSHTRALIPIPLRAAEKLQARGPVTNSDAGKCHVETAWNEWASANAKKFLAESDCNLQTFLIFCSHVSSCTGKQTKGKQQHLQIPHL